MNFRDAIVNLKSGLPIRRYNWPHEMNVINDGDKFVLVVEFVEWFPYSPSVEDVMANDWEIV